MTSISESRLERARARARVARCMNRSRERVGSLNSLVHSRTLRFGFPVCMRACPSVCARVRYAGARVCGRAVAPALTVRKKEKERCPGTQKEKDKDAERKRANRYGACETASTRTGGEKGRNIKKSREKGERKSTERRRTSERRS